MFVFALHLDPLSEIGGLRDVAVSVDGLVLFEFLESFSPGWICTGKETRKVHVESGLVQYS